MSEETAGKTADQSVDLQHMPLPRSSRWNVSVRPAPLMPVTMTAPA